MNILDAVKKAQKTEETFYFYYDDGSRSEYSVSESGLVLNYYGDMATFTVDRILSNKFTFTKKKASGTMRKSKKEKP